MKLIDEIRTGLPFFLTGIKGHELHALEKREALLYGDEIRGHITAPDIPVIVADDVEAFFAEKYRRGAPSLVLRETFPNQAPPFTRFWIEWRSERYRQALERLGCLVLSDRREDGWRTILCPVMKVTGRRTAVIFPSSYGVEVDPLGDIRYAKEMQYSGLGKIDEGGMLEMMSPVFPVALMTITFMNCKNVTVRTVDIPEKVSRAFERRHKNVSMARDVRIVEIAGIREIIRKKVAGLATERERELGVAQVCRGHFKRYTEDNKLFGKHTGTFFWSQHVRGGDLGEAAPAPRYQLVKGATLATK